MITITRDQARQIRTVFRRVLGITARSRAPTMLFDVQQNRLSIRATHDNVAIECRLPGEFQRDKLYVSFEILAECAARSNTPVTLDAQADQVVARWQSKGVPCSTTRELVKDEFEFPAKPSAMTSNPRELLVAIRAAAEVTTKDSARFALHCIQLRGSKGDVSATDGFQLLVQRGFDFPWEEDLLVHPSGLFDYSGLNETDTISVGRGKNHVVVQLGPYTLFLPIERGVQFPHIDDHIPAGDSATTTLTIAEDDAAFLLDSIKDLPSEREPNSPVTLDLNGSIALLARDEQTQATTQIVFSNSKRTGTQAHFNTNREFLVRALRLGLRTFYLKGAERPARAGDRFRDYIWMPLSPDGAVKPTKSTKCLVSPVNAAALNSNQSNTKRDYTTMANRISKKDQTTNGNGKSHHKSQSDNVSLESLTVQAESLKVTLREATTQVADLLTAIKRHRKHNKLVQSTLASLRQIQTLDA